MSSLLFAVFYVALIAALALEGERRRRKWNEKVKRERSLADALDNLHEPKARRFDPNSNAVGVQTPYGPISHYASGKSNAAAAVPWSNGTTSAQP